MFAPRRRQGLDGQLGDGPFAVGKQLLSAKSPARKPAPTDYKPFKISVVSLPDSPMKPRAKLEANVSVKLEEVSSFNSVRSPLNPLFSDDCLTGDFVDTFPAVIPAIVCCGPVAIFQNGTSLKWFQALDLGKMIAREKGEQVLGTVNSTGYILAYEMGCVFCYLWRAMLKLVVRYGKTPTSIGLICANPAGSEQLGSPATL